MECLNVGRSQAPEFSIRTLLALREPSDDPAGVTRVGGSGRSISTGGECRWGTLGMEGAHQGLEGMS